MPAYQPWLGIIAPFFINDGFFNCDAALNFVKPEQNAGVSGGAASSSGSPVRFHPPPLSTPSLLLPFLLLTKQKKMSTAPTLVSASSRRTPSPVE